MMILQRRSSVTAALLLILTLGSAGGCADLRRATSLPPVNPESPVAPAVAAAAPRSYPQPRLQDVPPAPKNVQPADMVKGQVIDIVRCRTAIRSYAPAHPPLSHGAVSFAASQREIAEISPADVPPPNSAALSEDLAARLRAFAAPPASIPSGPPPTSDKARPPAAPSSEPPSPAHAAAAAPAAPVMSSKAVQMAAPGAPVPPLPTPDPDPLLARCL